MTRTPNPDLAVGDDNKQRWNQPKHRRHGFHNAHRLFRRALMVRSRDVLMLEKAPFDLANAAPELLGFTEHPAFSAVSCVKADKIIFEAAAPDFNPT